jgi:hypothetical protein
MGRTTMTDDYEVGYRKPPKEHRFQPGTSGNQRGRPPRKKAAPLDVAAVLDPDVTVKVKDKPKKMSAFEVTTRQLAKKAIKQESVPAAIAFIKRCERYGVFDQALPRPSNVLTVPKDWNMSEWVDMFQRHGLPPWPGERSGLCGSDEQRLKNEVKS